MLKIHRNSIRILFPLFIGSFSLSAILYYLNLMGYPWCGFWSNIMIGIMGSSVLSLVLAIIGYSREKHSLFQVYYNKISDIVATLSKYKQCAPNKYDLAKNNAAILQQALGTKTCELGDLFSEFAFVWDKHDPSGRREYLFSLYQYFLDMKSLTFGDWIHLDAERCPNSILEHTDNVVLSIEKTNWGYSIGNRVYEDFDAEFDTLIRLVNGHLKFGEKLSFTKTPITDKVFCVLPEEDEQLILLMNQKVEKSRSRKIEASGILAEKAKDLFDKGLISALIYHEDVLTSMQVSDKAFYYFGYKERYQKRCN